MSDDKPIGGKWSFDEENGTTVFDQIGDDHITVGELSENNRSVWGAKGRAIYLNSSADSITSSVSVTDQNFTLSMWLKPKSQDFATFDKFFTLVYFYDHNTSVLKVFMLLLEYF